MRDALRGHEPPPLPSIARRGSYPWFVVGTVCIGSFIGQVDASMTQMLLPRLETDFAARLSTVSWVAVAYLLAMASFMPVFGRLADMAGRKLLYTGGFLVFVLGSTLCGFAGDLPTLIGFRILQGIGAALLTANSIAIVVTASGEEARGRALGLQSAAQAIGLGVGPAAGGLILDTLGWHWLFWINVPFGLAGAVLGWLVIPQTAKPPSATLPAGRFDWSGALLIGPALTVLIALLNEGHHWGLRSPWFAGSLIVAVGLLALFVRTERRAAAPLVDLGLLRHGAFVTGNLANFLSYALLFGVFFLIPFQLVRVYQETAFVAGLRLSLVPVLLGLMAPVGGLLFDRLGPRLATAGGMALCLLGLVLLYLRLDGQVANLPTVMLGLALVGAGQGLFVSPNTSAIMATAPAELTGEAGSLLNVVRFLGISAGIASASTVLALALDGLTGGGHGTVGASAAALVEAGRTVLVVLAAFALGAALLSLARSVPRGARSAPVDLG